MVTHRELDGSWDECLTPAGCPLQFHLPNTTVKAAEQLPFAVLISILEVLDPPDLVDDGTKYWTDYEGLNHREYDLPSTVFPDGTLRWEQHGLLHRDNDKPAVIEASGRMVWCQQGKALRLNDLPAILEANGSSKFSRSQKRARWAKNHAERG